MSIDRTYAVAISEDGTPYLAKEATLKRRGMIRASYQSPRHVQAARTRAHTPAGPHDVTAEARRVLDDQRRAMGPIHVPAYPREWFPELLGAGERAAHNNTLPEVPIAGTPPTEYDRALFARDLAAAAELRKGPGTITWGE